MLPVGLLNNHVHQLTPQEEVKNLKNINAHTSTNNIIIIITKNKCSILNDYKINY